MNTFASTLDLVGDTLNTHYIWFSNEILGILGDLCPWTNILITWKWHEL